MPSLTRSAAVALGLCLLSPGISAQLAKDLPAGTTKDAIVRAYGWPSGRSAAGDREVWTYPTFQVTLVDGRVVNVSAMPPSKTTSRRPVPVRVPGSTSTTLPAVRETRPTPPPTKSVTSKPGSNVRAAPPDQSVERPSTGIDSAKRSSVAPRQRPSLENTLSPWYWLKALWPLAIVVVAGAVAKKLLVDRRRLKREATARARAAESAAAKKDARPKTWKDVVGEAVGRTSRASPPLLGNTPPPRAPDRVDLSLELLREIEWKRFELIVARYYGATGVRAECTCTGPDGGVDVKLFRAGEERAYCYIQCKAWGSEKVPVTKIREFLGAMAADKVLEGIFVTTSDYWPDARAFAEANGIAAVTAADFVGLFEQLPLETRKQILDEVTAGDYTTPSCPKCDVKVASRERKRDGVKFWACSRCNWTMTARAA